MNSGAFGAFDGIKTAETNPDYSNMIAVNRWGDVFALEPDGLKYAPMKKVDSTSSHVSIIGDELSILPSMASIKFNAHGSIMLTWGPRAVATVAFPLSYAIYGGLLSHGEQQSCNFKVILTADSGNGHSRVVAARWHPFHNECVVVLFENGPLVTINVTTGEKTTIYLGKNMHYSSFCFGSNLQWLSVTVLVLSTDGKVLVICPVLPPGSSIPAEIVMELTDSISRENELAASSNDDHMKLLKLANLYMSAAFGDLSADFEGSNGTVTVGGSLAEHNSAIGEKELTDDKSLKLEMLRCPAATQGAMPQKLQQSSSPDPSVTACDIASLPASFGEHGFDYLWSQKNVAPVVAISWTDGRVSLLVIKGQVKPI
jgi:hypothetical protein